jgi:hypothetical protein
MRPCFIISLPRAGSTLLQRLLSRHPRIRTISEPWMALPFAYVLREQGVLAEYSQHSMRKGFRHFLGQIEGAERSYYREAGEMLLRLQTSHARSDADYFLDKTPRYYLILEELQWMFPEARFIVLHRNPLAVVASILNTWTRNRFRLKSSAMDIYEGPARIMSFLKQGPARLLELNFDELVTHPEAQLRCVSDFLELAPLASASLSGSEGFQNQPLGDPTGVKRYQQVSSEPVHQWKGTFASPLRRQWARRYLEFLGEPTLARMGCDSRRLTDALGGSGFSPRQFLTDLIDFHWRTLLLYGAPSLEFVRVRKRRDVRPAFRWRSHRG